MTKKFIPIKSQKKTLRLFENDIKSIYYMRKIILPPIPKFNTN